MRVLSSQLVGGSMYGSHAGVHRHEASPGIRHFQSALGKDHGRNEQWRGNQPKGEAGKSDMRYARHGCLLSSLEPSRPQPQRPPNETCNGAAACLHAALAETYFIKAVLMKTNISILHRQIQFSEVFVWPPPSLDFDVIYAIWSGGRLETLFRV
jgi:hypothetical protein